MNCLRKDFEDVVKLPFYPSTYTHLIVVEVKQTFTEKESQKSELSLCVVPVVESNKEEKASL